MHVHTTMNKGLILLSLVVTSVARKFNGKLLGEGEHVVTITTVAETLSKPSEFWKDQTPQIEIGMKDAEGKVITHWLNQKGYMRASDYPNSKAPKGVEFRSSENGNEMYAVDIKSGNRIESADRTADCERIIGEFANDCGIAAGEEGTLEGKTVGIGVRKNARDNYEVHYSKPASKVKSTEDAEA